MYVKIEKFNEIVNQVIELSQKLKSLDDENLYIRAGKAGYWLSEVSKLAKRWPEFLGEIDYPILSFEFGNETGIKILPSKTNCPMCGLNPIEKDDYGFYHCSLCGKWFIFSHKLNGRISYLREGPDDIIYVS